MASFCPKCGAAIAPGAQTCSSCGTAIVGALGAQPAVAPVQPVAAPAKSGGALKIVLIILCVFVGLGIVAAGTIGYLGWRVAHSIKVSGKGDQVSISVPGGGSFSANTSATYSPEELGVDMYPGATAGKATARMSTPAGSWVTAVFVTADTQDKVLAFYKDKLGNGVSSLESSEGAVLTLKKGEKEAVVVTITPNSSEYAGKTQITIMHTTATKST